MTGPDPTHHASEELSLEQMIAFLENRLDPQERDRIEQILAENETYIDALEALETSMRKDPDTAQKALSFRDAFVKEAFRQADMTAPAPRTIPFYRSPRILSIAAAILILMIPLGYLIFRSPAPNQMARDLIVAYPDLNTRGDPQADIMAQAMVLYGAKSYEEAIPLLENIPPADTLHYMDAKMYLAISYLLTDKETAALEPLKIVIEDGDNPHIFAAQWYQALIYTSMEQYDTARPLLEAIAREPGPYQNKAAELLGAWK